MKSDVLKKLLFIFLLMFIGHSALAQKISYNHKVLMIEGCTNVFDVASHKNKQDESSFSLDGTTFMNKSRFIPYLVKKYLE